MREYEKWVGQLSPKDRRRVEQDGLLKPEVSYKASKRFGDVAAIELSVGAEVWEPREEKIEEGADVDVAAETLRALRVILANILYPQRGSTVQREVEIVGLAIGMPGLESMSAVARRHGVGKGAISKAVLKITDETGLPPSIYMKSFAARQAYAESNVRNRKGVTNA